MPKVHFYKDFPTLETLEGSNLMECLQKSGRPVASSCLGEAVCGKCLMRIVSLEGETPDFNELEKLWRRRNNPKNNERLSCQFFVEGDIKVDVDYW